MVDFSKISAVDRSKFFRHKTDYELLGRYLEENISLKPVNALVVGVGNLEEPLSILATAAETVSALRSRGISINLAELLKLSLLEARTKEEISPVYSLGKGYGSERSLMGGIFLTPEQKKNLPQHPLKPRFVDDYPAGFELRGGEYFFSEEVVDRVQEAVREGKFDTRIQEVIDRSAIRYPIIFFNNVITHLGADGERITKDLTTQLLEREGIVFMHHSGSLGDSKGVGGITKMVEDNPNFVHLQRIGPAVYRRKI